MNILYHHRTQGTGAEGVHIAFVIKGFRQAGHTVRVVSPNSEEPSATAGANPFARRSGGLKKKVLARLSRVLPQWCFELMEMGYDRIVAPKIRALIKSGSVDLIYERYAFFMTAGARAAREHGVPYFVEVNEIAGHKRIRGQVFTRQARRAEQLIFRQADAIIVVSAFLKDEIVKLGVDPVKIQVIPNGADPELFDPARFSPMVLRRKLAIPEPTVVFGFIGWFVGWHDLEWFIEQFACLKDRDVRLCLVGDGPLKERLRSKAEACGVADKVVFTGAVPYEQVPEYIAMMDVGVIPGSNAYRSPIKLFEYMIMGKTVLAPRYQPIESIITHLVDGSIFDPRDASGLKQQLARIEGDAALRDQLGTRARNKVMQQHLWRHNAERILDIYKQKKGKGPA